MPENEEPSIDQLRALVTASAEATEETENETPAPPKEEKPAPAPEPELTQEQKRSQDGKFKKAEEPEDPPGVKKRIGKALQAQREAEAKATELEARLAKLQGPPPAKEQAQPAKAPKQEDFTTYDEYSRAIARYEARQEINAELETQRVANEARQREASKAKRAADFTAAEVEARKAHTDYDEVIAGIEWPKAPGSSALADYLLDTNNANLYYALGQKPEELARIAAMPPNRAIAALAKFEAALEAPADKKTQAKELPKPPRNVGGGGSPAVIDLNDEKLGMRAFKREFQRRLAANDD